MIACAACFREFPVSTIGYVKPDGMVIFTDTTPWLCPRCELNFPDIHQPHVGTG